MCKHLAKLQIVRTEVRWAAFSVLYQECQSHSPRVGFTFHLWSNTRLERERELEIIRVVYQRRSTHHF
jgi:hypothetical protein